jgi:hypothetical protein
VDCHSLCQKKMLVSSKLWTLLCIEVASGILPGILSSFAVSSSQCAVLHGRNTWNWVACYGHNTCSWVVLWAQQLQPSGDMDATLAAAWFHGPIYWKWMIFHGTQHLQVSGLSWDPALESEWCVVHPTLATNHSWPSIGSYSPDTLVNTCWLSPNGIWDV